MRAFNRRRYYIIMSSWTFSDFERHCPRIIINIELFRSAPWELTVDECDWVKYHVIAESSCCDATLRLLSDHYKDMTFVCWGRNERETNRGIVYYTGVRSRNQEYNAIVHACCNEIAKHAKEIQKLESELTLAKQRLAEQPSADVDARRRAANRIMAAAELVTSDEQRARARAIVRDALSELKLTPDTVRAAAAVCSF